MAPAVLAAVPQHVGFGGQASVVKAEGGGQDSREQPGRPGTPRLGGINEAESARKLSQAEPCETHDVESLLALLCLALCYHVQNVDHVPVPVFG